MIRITGSIAALWAVFSHSTLMIAGFSPIHFHRLLQQQQDGRNNKRRQRPATEPERQKYCCCRRGQQSLPQNSRISQLASSLTNNYEAQREEDDSRNDALQRIQRSFRRFDWQHQNKTYHINYRVEPPTISTPSKPLLLVHGFGANLNHFRQNIPALQEAGYQVFAIDLIGFGASQKPTDVEYSIELFVQLLHDFVHEMNDRYTNNDRYASYQDDTVPWMVAGNSIGGLCSLGLAKALPEQIQGVVLLNCATGMSAFRYTDVPLFVRPLLYVMQNVVLKGGVGEWFFEQFRSRDNVQRLLHKGGVYRNAGQVNPELLEILLGPSDDDNAAHVFCNVMGGDPGPRPEQYLTDISCPVLALWGDSDPWVPHHTARDWHALHTDFDLQVLPDTGHCPHDDRPELVHEAMIPWMQQVVQRYDPQKHAFVSGESGCSTAATNTAKENGDSDDVTSFLESAMEGISDMIYDEHQKQQQQQEEDDEEDETDTET